MLITESQMNYGRSIDAMSILNTLPYIQESVSPSLVPVVESTTRGQHIVDLQSLVDFNESSGINDLGYALHLVCESSGISDSNVVFSVQEESIIEDSSLASLCESMLDDGLLVYAKPLSSNDPVSKLGQLCLEQAEKDGNYERWLEFFTEGSSVQQWYQDMKNREDKYIQDIRDDYGGKYYGLEDLFRQVSNPGERARILDDMIKSGKVNVKQYRGDIISDIRNGASLQTIQNNTIRGTDQYGNVMSNESPFIFRNRRNAYNTASLNTDDLQDKVQNQLFNYHLTRFNIKNAGHWLNQKEARENEEAFNLAKQKELDRINQLKGETKNQDVEGTNDRNVQERLETLQKMIEKEKFPKSWLAKKIAWLRSLYRNIMLKWSIKKRETNIFMDTQTGFVGNILGFWKRIAAWILRLIDKLALKLQNAVA